MSILSFQIARRLSLASRSGRTSPAVGVAITAVALSVAVMLAAIAIVLGFKREIRDKIIGFNSHATVYVLPDETGDNLLTLTPSLKEFMASQEYVTDYSLEVSLPSIFKTEGDFKGIYLRSLGSKSTRSFIRSNLEEGMVPDFSKDENRLKILISRLAADQLNLKLGDKVDTYFINDDIRVRRLEVAGIYNSHFDSYDDVNVYGALPLIQQLASITPNQGTTLQLDVTDFDQLADLTLLMQQRLMEATSDGTLYRTYRVENVLNQGAGYFQWLALLDTNVIVVLVLMIFVACVTLISGMLMIILDKKPLIGLLRALGMRRPGIRGIFIWLALKVAVIGMIIGNGLMLILLWMQNHYHFLRLDPEAYYIDFVPVEFRWSAFILLNIGVIIIIFLSLLLPSIFATRISPTETLKYE